MKYVVLCLTINTVFLCAQTAKVDFPHYKGQAYVSYFKKDKSQTTEQSFCLHVDAKYLQTPLDKNNTVSNDTLSFTQNNQLRAHQTLKPLVQLMNVTGEFKLSESLSCLLSAPISSHIDWNESDGISINELTVFRCHELKGKPVFLFNKTLYNQFKNIKKYYPYSINVYGFFGADADKLENFTKNKISYKDLSLELFNASQYSPFHVLNTQKYKAAIDLYFTLDDTKGSVDSAQVKRWSIPK